MPTLSAFASEQYLPFAKNAKRSWRTDETILRLHILPVLGSQRLDEIDDKSVAALVSAKGNAGYSSGTTNRITILIRYLFNLAHKWGVLGITNNPAAGLKIVADVCRERFLTVEERHRLVQALEADENKSAAAAIKLLLLTGGRRNEVTQARWDYIDWDKRTLLVPLSKSGKPRHIISERRRNKPSSFNSAERQRAFRFPVWIYWKALPFIAFSMVAHTQESRTGRCSLTRPPTFVRQSPR